jgi:hypothetical protein
MSPLLALSSKISRHRGHAARTTDTTEEYLRRMLKKAGLLTRPTLARRDAAFLKQGHSELSLY